MHLLSPRKAFLVYFPQTEEVNNNNPFESEMASNSLPSTKLKANLIKFLAIKKGCS